MAANKDISPPELNKGNGPATEANQDIVVGTKVIMAKDKHPHAVTGKTMTTKSSKTARKEPPSAAAGSAKQIDMKRHDRPVTSTSQGNTDISLLTGAVTQMATNMSAFMEGFQKTQMQTMAELKRTQQEFLNSFCDNEGDFFIDESYESDHDTPPTSAVDELQNLLPDGRQSPNDATLSCQSVQNNNTELETVSSAQGTHEESGLLSEWLAEYTKDEQCGPKISEDLAKVMNNMIQHGVSEEKMNELTGLYKRPQNCERLSVTKVNPPIWESLTAETRSGDIKLQRIQQIMLKGLTPLALLAEKFIEAAKDGAANDSFRSLIKDGFRLLTDGMTLITAAHSDINGRRRVLMRGDVNESYRSLCTTKGDNTTWLFGDDLVQRLRDINETNRVSQKVNRGNSSHRYTPYSPMRQNFPRVRGRGRGFAKPSRGYGSYRARGFLDVRPRPFQNYMSAKRRRGRQK